jgi:acyl-coenzyme A synthetase/AMP-(fatty) acid ligase
VIGAFVVKEAAAILDGSAVKAFAASHLAAYKVPREVVFVDAIPRTRNGKVHRKKLAAVFPRCAMRNRLRD